MTQRFTVEQARKAAGLTVAQTAYGLGISPNAYTAKEKHQTRFYYDEAIRFSEMTGIPIDMIFFEQKVAE